MNERSRDERVEAEKDDEVEQRESEVQDDEEPAGEPGVIRESGEGPGGQFE